MGFWSKVLGDALEERNEHDIDRAWAKKERRGENVLPDDA